VTASVPTLGNFTCWIALTPNGQFAFTSNTLSSSISGFAIGGSGTVTALPGTVVASLPTGSNNLDIAVSDDAKFVYTMNTGAGTIGIFAVQPNGRLKVLASPPVSVLTADLRASPRSKKSEPVRGCSFATRFAAFSSACCHPLPLYALAAVSQEIFSVCHPTSRSRTTTDGPRAGDGRGPWRSRLR
jgi:Lactonase, 7-bladed beta-propeller